MKTNTKFLKFCMLAGIAAITASCSDEVKPLLGDYSYNTSGQVAIDDTVQVVLSNEIGSMELERVKDNDIMLTMNSLRNGVYATQGTLDGDTISLVPFTRTMSVTYQTSDIVPTTVTENYNVEVSGKGKVYNETIHFYLKYSGESLSNGKKLTGENILMVAKKN